MPPPASNFTDKHFVITLGDGKNKTGTCRHCQQVIKSYQLSRAKHHLAGNANHGVKSCPSVPEDVKLKLQAEFADVEKKKEEAAKKVQQRRRLAEATAAEACEDGGGQGEAAPKRQTTMEEWAKRTTNALDDQLGRFLFHAGLSFCRVAPRIRPLSAAFPTFLTLVSSCIHLFHTLCRGAVRHG